MQILNSDSDEDGDKSKEKKQLLSVSDASKGTGEASTSKLGSQNEIDHLSEMFPDKSRDDLEACLNVQGSFSKAVTTLLPENFFTHDDDEYLMAWPFQHSENTSDTHGLKSELLELQKNFSPEQREKLKIDEDDLLNDAMAYYKDQTFDATRRLRIIYRGQPAADTGGVLRQFYTELLIAVSNAFFHGENYRSPIYNCDMVASGVMKLVGTIIVHSILQGGPGFPVFGPAVYNYLVTGDVQEAMKGLTIKDCSCQMAHFISMVRVQHFIITLTFSGDYKQTSAPSLHGHLDTSADNIQV